MAMAALQKASILPQQNLSNSYPSVIDRQSRSSRSSPVFPSVTTLSGSCIPLLSLVRRSRIQDRGGVWRAEQSGQNQTDSTEDKAEKSTATSLASPREPKLGEGGGGAKGFGAASKSSVATEKKKGSKSSSSASGSKRRAPPSKPLIGASAADQQTQQVETAVVASLAFLFVVILFEGLLLASSGFLPEDWDEFIVNSIYPAFTPSVGVFLAIAASYGLWKFLGGGPGTSSK